MLIGYERVSTNEQDLDLQKDALKKDGCEKICVDETSGSVVTRPGLEKALEMLREKDVLVVWRLDRLGRSLKNLIELIGELEQPRGLFPKPSRIDGHFILWDKLTSGFQFSCANLAVVDAPQAGLRFPETQVGATPHLTDRHTFEEPRKWLKHNTLSQMNLAP